MVCMIWGLTFAPAVFLWSACSPAFAEHAKPLLQQQDIIEFSKVHIRPAEKQDLDDVATVILDAFAPSALYHYAFPQFERFREYHWKCLRKELGRQFADIPENAFLNVISVPNDSRKHTGDSRHNRAVAVAAWKIIEPTTEVVNHKESIDFGLHLEKSSCSDNLDTNMTRALNFSRQFSLAEKHYVNEYPGKQVYLALLATHPDWDGHGFGATHCQWGMAMAAEMKAPVTLIATPAGWPLYDELGFE